LVDGYCCPDVSHAAKQDAADEKVFSFRWLSTGHSVKGIYTSARLLFDISPIFYHLPLFSALFLLFQEALFSSLSTETEAYRRHSNFSP
jgi:hypothetical protein